MKSKIVLILSIIIALLLGYSVGVTNGMKIAFNQGLMAADVLLDVQLSGKAKNMISSYPEIIRHLTPDEREKLGLNNTELIKDFQLNKLNETLNTIIVNKYGK